MQWDVLRHNRCLWHHILTWQPEASAQAPSGCNHAKSVQDVGVHLCVQLAGDKLLDLAGGPDVCRLDLGQAGEGPAQLAAHKVGVAIGSGAALL